MELASLRLEAVFRDSTDPILIENLDGIVVDLNDEAVRTYGFARKELVGHPIKTIVPPDKHRQADELLIRCRSGERVRDVEGVRVTKRGKRIPVLLSLSLLRDDDQNAVAIATFAKDISQLTEAEADLRQMSKVFVDSVDPIIIEDLDGMVVDMNLAAERLYGWKRSELVRQPIKVIVPESRHGQAEEMLAQCKRGEEVRDVEGVRLSKDGDEVPVLLTLSLLTDDHGTPTHVASFAKDITKLKQAEADLRRLNDELEARVVLRTAELDEANQRLRHELAVARELSDTASREHEAVLIGNSIAVRSLRASIEAHSRDDEAVFLTGPQGAGHEAVARALHRESPRAGRPFIYVDVANASSSEETLFQTSTDAAGERVPGKVSLADGGTLYLAGVDRLGSEAQASLLRFLKDSDDIRATAGKPSPDVRVISSASRELSEEAREGRFDTELAAMLTISRLSVPALAERRDDIIPIADRVVLLKARTLGKVIDGISEQAKKSLQSYLWPGNIEELQSVLERAVTLTHDTQLSVPDNLLRAGPKVGSYTLSRRLGAGAMGEVWLARHELLARPAAVKLIRKEALNVPPKQQGVLQTRFQREASATAQLRSPHTVELYDFGVGEDGSFYYVMEYLTGLDLHTLVERHGPLNPERAIYLLQQACSSLAEAHEVGLVHRDIKPSNLFACQLGGVGDFLKVLDFGVVRMANSDERMVTATGQLLGTPVSMAPEMAEGEQAGPASDLYGLGCAAYWLLTGQPVFDAPALMVLMMQHISKVPTPLVEHNPSVPAELNELVMACLEKQPENRPATAEELRERLSKVPTNDAWNAVKAIDWWRRIEPAVGPNLEKQGASEPADETIDASSRG